MALAFIKIFDVFGHDAPSFNIGGRKTVATLTGAFLTLIMYTLVLAFSSLKF